MFTDEEILLQTAKIQYLYRLKREIRYDETRTELGESVAEHIFGMHVLANYFLALEDPHAKWDRNAIYEMITWHDIDEIETGDMIGYLKTPADRERENAAMQAAISNSPSVIQKCMQLRTDEYEQQETIESRFVKALDRIEPLFQIYNANGKEVLLRCKTTFENHRMIKDAYVAEFPFMKHFNHVISTKMEEEGFFTKGA